MYNTEVVTPGARQLVRRVGSTPRRPYAGKVTAYDSPIYIADAAVYLMATQPELGITNPYALDETQFEAAVDLLKQQRGIIGRYWAPVHRPDQRLPVRRHRRRARRGRSPPTCSRAADPPTPVEVILPKEGSTGWSDTWMLRPRGAAPQLRATCS